MNRLKKMALHVIAKNMAEHEITGLKELFKSFDTDNSGTITLKELREGLHSMVRTRGTMFDAEGPMWSPGAERVDSRRMQLLQSNNKTRDSCKQQNARYSANK